MSRHTVSVLVASIFAGGCGDSVQADGTGTDTGSTGSGGTSAPTTGGADTAEPTGAGSSGEGTSEGTGTPGSTGEPGSTAASSSSGIECPANAAPATPTVLEPLPDRIDVVAADMKITGSPFMDADAGDVLGGVEAEIWRVKDGALGERVWHAERDGEGTPTLTLADGSFDADPALEDWKDHVVRVRYRDEHAACSAWSEWSEYLLFRTDDGSSVLFDQEQILDFYIDIPPESWEKINDEALPPGCVPYSRNYYKGALRFGDQTLPGVGIKVKGGCGSSRDLGGKASFKINLEWDDPAVVGCPGSRRLLGEKSFTFNNGVQDRSASNERIGYPIFRELGVPAPRAASVRIFVNDELWGLYTHVETIDRRFLSRWYDDNNGMMYEGTYWCDLTPNNVPAGDEDDSYCITREFSGGVCSEPEPGADPTNYDLVRELTEKIEALPPGEFYPEVATFFDYDRFLTTWAIESVIDHWDNYAFGIQNNYRIYHDPVSDHWTLISTGIDQTFEKNQDAWGVQGVLAARCISEPDCEAAFAARLDEVNDAIEAMDLASRADSIRQQISEAVMEDPRKEYDFNTFNGEHEGLLDFFEKRPDEVRGQLSGHGF